MNYFQLKVSNHLTNHDFSIKFWTLKDNPNYFDFEAKKQEKAKDGFVKVNEVYKHDSI